MHCTILSIAHLSAIQLVTETQLLATTDKIKKLNNFKNFCEHNCSISSFLHADQIIRPSRNELISNHAITRFKTNHVYIATKHSDLVRITCVATANSSVIVSLFRNECLTPELNDSLLV